jgi:hypothetical protein
VNIRYLYNNCADISNSIIVDAIEENPNYGQCLNYLTTVASSDDIRLLILSQPVEKLRKGLEWVWNVHEISIIEHSSADISQYAESRITQLLLQRPHLEPKRAFITSAIQDGARGMFQWVNTAMDYLQNYLAHIEDVEDTISDLPGDLLNAYEKIFNRMELEKSTARIKSRIKAALRFLAASATPVTALDLEAALDVCESLQKDERRNLSAIWT